LYLKLVSPRNTFEKGDLKSTKMETTATGHAMDSIIFEMNVSQSMMISFSFNI